MAQNIYQFQAQTLQGELINFDSFKGKVLLVVNVASQCGFTNQYSELETLYKKFGPSQFVVLGFPCNQFGEQEPGSDAEIQNFCTSRFQVSFPMFKKIEVNGKNEDPLFSYLKKSAKGLLGSESIKWNFTKFLVDREGHVLTRYAPATSPLKISAEIEKLLV